MLEVLIDCENYIGARTPADETGCPLFVFPLSVVRFSVSEFPSIFMCCLNRRPESCRPWSAFLYREGYRSILHFQLAKRVFPFGTLGAYLP